MHVTKSIRPKVWRAVLALGLTAATGGAVGAMTTGTAHAASCPNGYFCWYSWKYQYGYRGYQYYYTNGWIRLNSLVDNSESTYDAQYADPRTCPNGYNPLVYLSDNKNGLRWVALVGDHHGDRLNTFNPIGTSRGTANMNNRFNDIWNLCY